ncbi:hypothetical protein OQA88_7906 [Cercophora sp. LCS_1]
MHPLTPLSFLLPLTAALSSLALQAHTVYQYPNPTWVENIAIRPNDALLLTLLTSPTLQTIPEPDAPKPIALDVYTFPNSTSLIGIAPLASGCEDDDAYLLISGNPNIAGSFIAWTVTYPNNNNKHDNTNANVNDSDKPIIKRIADLTKSGLPNGIVSLGPSEHAVLIADSFLGLIWRLDIQTGKYHVYLQNAETSAPAGSPPNTVAVNGLKISHGYLYFTNSAKVAIYRVKIDEHGRVKEGTQVETVANLSAANSFLDDFAIRNGIIWVATNSPDNKVFAVDINTGQYVVVLNVAGPTAAAFGRGKDDKDVLYVTTNGGLRGAPNGVAPEGGKVVAVNTKGFRFS